MTMEVEPVSGVKIVTVIGLLASFAGVAQTILWFGVGAGLLLGVALQIAASILAIYLVVKTIPELRPAPRHHPAGLTPA
jgi:hypothetical protein